MFISKKTYLLIAACFFIITTSYTQENDVVLIHSHNDYLQKTPFWLAYTNGANSIEVDVYLDNKTLKVAHSKEEIVDNNTLETMYLKPITSILKKRENTLRPLILLIDIKSEAKKTLNAIIKSIKKFPSIIKNKQIQIVISGNRPDADNYTSFPDYIYFDHQEIEQELSTETWKKVAMVSTSFKNYSNWNGLGRLTHLDLAKVKNVIEKVHSFGKPFRFWAIPDTKTAWRTFIDLGVNIINTDKPSSCNAYVKSIKKRNAITTIFSEVYIPKFKVDQQKSSVKNVILLIGDGNGLAQISSAVLANNGALTLTQLKSIGLIKTQSADDFTTDSAGAGTALATGKKTNNRAIGTDINGKPIQNIIELLASKGFKTGIVSTDEITGATPASFYAHQVDRSKKESIAKDLLVSKLHFFAAGGQNTFNALPISNTFKTLESLDSVVNNKSDRVGVFLAKESISSIMDGRSNILAEATKQGVNFLSRGKKPFFLMVEAAKIDSYGHLNNTMGIVTETIDFDKAITEAIKFADSNKETLVVVTADHETSGFSVVNGNLITHEIEGNFVTHDHTSIMVPVFAYGPYSHEFQGVYENNEIFLKIVNILNKK